MSRHRNVRKIDIDDEMFDGVYGRSCDENDDYCVSPSTEAEFMFRRDKQHTLSSFIEKSHDEKIVEETYNEQDYYYEDAGGGYEDDTNKDIDIQFCIEQLNDVLGSDADKSAVVQASIKHNGDASKALNQVLDGGTSSTTTSAANFQQPKSSSAANFQQPKLTLATGYFPDTSGHVVTTPKAVHVFNKSKAVSPPQVHRSNKKKRDVSPNSASSSGVCSPAPVVTSASRADFNLLDDGERIASPLVKLPKSVKGREVIDVKAELKKREDGKELINLVVIGHVDAGKSTLMGHLLFNLGNVSKKVMHKNEMESKKSGKGSFAFAWVLDETEEERARGVTIDVAMTVFETKSKIVTLMDAPGHRDFIPNMIQGTAQADVAILVVDSRPGEFEAGFEAGGQTREHAILARSLGVGQLIVAVNKMDSTEWSKERYDAIVLKLKSFLTKQAGFREKDVFYIPCSGLSGENLTEKGVEPLLTSWYSKHCLVELIDTFKSPPRPVDKPFRCCVSDVFKGQGAITVAGKVETGSVQNGDRVMICPAGEGGIIKGLLVRDEPVKFAAAGDHIMGAIHGVDLEHISVGSILCDMDNPVRTTTNLVARIVVFENTIPITKGFMVVFHSQNMSEPATVSKLVSILNKASGEVIQKRPRCLTKQMNAVIEVKFARPVCVELYRDNKILGRFMLRYSGKTIAAGVIIEVK